jgi:TRAP-type mannitol/chloroaromatic compound transport system substrate-binding protein
VRAVAERLFAKYDVVGMPCGAFARQEDFWSRKPLRDVADLKGLKLRIGGWSAAVYTKLGVSPQQIAGGEIYEALQRGTIDAALWLAPRSGTQIGLDKVARHYYYPGVVMPAVILDLVVKKSAWEKLMPDHRQIVEAACAEVAETMLAEAGEGDAAAAAELKRSGVAVAPLPASIQKALYDANRKLMSELSPGNEVLRALTPIVDGLTSNTVAANIK